VERPIHNGPYFLRFRRYFREPPPSVHVAEIFSSRLSFNILISFMRELPRFFMYSCGSRIEPYTLMGTNNPNPK
jgi:hypothetical protein